MGFPGYKQILLTLNATLKVPQHSAIPKGNVHLTETNFTMQPVPTAPPSLPFCQHQPLHSDGVSMLGNCHLFPAVSKLVTKQDLKQ